MTQRPLELEDLLTLQNVADPQISPDGARVAFTVTHIDVDKNTYRSAIWVGAADGSTPPRRWTGGAWNDSGPRWSPDSRRLAFVSDRQEEQVQVYVLDVDGGEAQAVTRFESGSVQGVRWSPDGTQLAFLYRAAPPDRTKKAQKEREDKNLSAPPRVHTRLFYRLDGAGYWDDSYWQVAVINAAGGETHTLTHGPWNCDVPCWSPDSRTLAFLSDRRPDSDAERDADTGVWTIDVPAGDPVRVSAPLGDKQSLFWSPDGRRFAYLGNPDPRDNWGMRNDRVFTLPREGGEAQDLTGHTDQAAGYLTLSDTDTDTGDALAWSADGTRLFYAVSVQGSVRLCTVPASGGDPAPLTPEGQAVTGFSLAEDSKTAALTLGTDVAPAEVFAGQLNAHTLTLKPLSQINQPWLETIKLQMPEPFALQSESGNDVPGWYLLPPNFQPGVASPLLVYLHGGPSLQYGHLLFHELQWLAAQGFVVAYPNPRGSKGYGEMHTGAIKGNWGGPALADIHALVDDALARGYARPESVGILGGSYGGYLTAWAIGHTDRFACAIADRLVASLPSMSGTCDFPWSHGDYYGGNAWDDPADLWRHSPLAFAGRIQTPLLLIHSDGDLRCPIGQAEELFAALRLQKKPVEFVRYPSEASHGLSRNGPPDLRLDRLRRNLAWLRKHLQTREEHKG